MNNQFSWAWLLLAIVALSACKPDNCEESRQAFVLGVEGPATTQVNQEITYQITFGVDNGCGDFGYFQKTEDGNTFTFVLYADYLGCVCTEIFQIKQTNLRFVTPDPGTYYFRYLSGSNQYLTDSLVVN